MKRSFFARNSILLSAYFILLLVACYFIVQFEKHEIHLYINNYVGNRYLNAIFYAADHLGDGWMAPILILAAAIVNVRAGIYTATALIVASLLSTFFKYFVFEDVHRPAFVFQYYIRQELKLVDGVNVGIHNSFPSGHTTQAFAIFMSLALASKRHLFKLLFLFCALMPAFSRVYLSQHWLVDIVAGSVLGTCCSLIFYFVYIHKGRLPSLNKPLKALLPQQKQ